VACWHIAFNAVALRVPWEGGGGKGCTRWQVGEVPRRVALNSQVRRISLMASMAIASHTPSGKAHTVGAARPCHTRRDCMCEQFMLHPAAPSSPV